ncbi:MAG: DUF72 domain-containing protein, partial [Elusimicrobia bacterium]|nr:DUF72 domain-containing protein [Elusimicrobiota bacterium]
DKVPEGFIFAVKGSRFITHMKKLKDPRPSLKLLFERASALKEKLGPVLFQLPPGWDLNLPRFHDFLDALPKKRRFTFELRNPTWFTDEVFQALADHGASLCVYQIAGRSSPVLATADFVYVRLHGPTGAAYQGSYSDADLRIWAARIGGWLRENRDVFVYFDNDQMAYAAQDADRLRRMVGVPLKSKSPQPQRV